MCSLDLGALPVCEGQRLVGMVTDRNITIRATAYGHDPNTTPVRHYMSSDLICCFEDQDIKEAEELTRLWSQKEACSQGLTRQVL
jgi:CBS domain-containing protein